MIVFRRTALVVIMAKMESGLRLRNAVTFSFTHHDAQVSLPKRDRR